MSNEKINLYGKKTTNQGLRAINLRSHLITNIFPMISHIGQFVSGFHLCYSIQPNLRMIKQANITYTINSCGVLLLIFYKYKYLYYSILVSTNFPSSKIVIQKFRAFSTHSSNTFSQIFWRGTQTKLAPTQHLRAPSFVDDFL